MSNKNPKHIDCLWGLICSMSAIDQQNNNISLFNIINQINVPFGTFGKEKDFISPRPHELMVVFRRVVPSKLCTNVLVLDVKVSLIDPLGKALSEMLVPIKFDAGKRIMRFRFQIPGFKLTNPGDYVYRVETRQPSSDQMEKVSEIPFEAIEMTENK